MSEVTPSFVPESHGNVPYPVAFRADIVDRYHGIPVHDPYQWMETPSDARTEWLAVQRQLVSKYGPDDDTVSRIETKFKGYLPAAIDGCTVTRGDKEFFYRSALGQLQHVFVCRDASGRETATINPNHWSADGSVGLTVASISNKGEYVAFARNPDDTDKQIWQILDTSTGDILPDTLPQTLDTYPSWDKEGTGFFYERTDKDGRRPVLYHRLGTTMDQDVPYFQPVDEDTVYYTSKVATDGRQLYIVGYQEDGTYSVDVMDVNDPKSSPRRLVSPDEAMTGLHILFNEGDRHVLLTNKDSPNGRIVTRQLGTVGLSDIIAESSSVITDAAMAGEYIALTYYDGISSYAVLHDKSGAPVHKIMPVEQVGAVSLASYGIDDERPTVEIESPARPPTTYGINLINFQKTVIEEPLYKFTSDQYQSDLLYATSQDGTRIPMFVTAAKSTRLDGSNHTIVEGYGGFGNGTKPEFNPYLMPWLESGGVYVQTCLRGGNEFGSRWHDSGKKSGKAKVVQDFIASGMAILDAGYATSENLVAKGASNGGFIVAASMLARPELFKAVLVSDAILDMIRFDKGTQEISGRYWRDEYGRTTDEAEFKFLLGISPVHNIQPALYPAVYAAAGEEDDRVVPANTYKFIAALQAMQKGGNPILLEVEPAKGHGVTSIDRCYRKVAREYAFLERVLGVKIG